MIEGDNGILAVDRSDLIWLEMSVTDAAEVSRRSVAMASAGDKTLDCPTQAGCHRTATGNTQILAGADRAAFETVLPILTTIGWRVLHTGALNKAK